MSPVPPIIWSNSPNGRGVILFNRVWVEGFFLTKTIFDFGIVLHAHDQRTGYCIGFFLGFVSIHIGFTSKKFTEAMGLE